MADLLQDIVALRDRVKALRAAPAKVKGDHALYDAWNAILNQNYQASAWQADLDDISKAANWVRAADGAALHLQPARWSMAVHHLASECYVGLSVALARYLGFRWTWVLGVIKVGAISTSNAPVGSKAAVAAAKGKQAAAHAEQAKKVADAYKAMVVQLEADLKKMQGELGSLRDGVSGQILAMQVAEEKRLRGLLAANAALTPAQVAGAKAILAEMDDLRTDFKNYDGPPNAAVTLVSKWKARREAAEAAIAGQ